ncbi:MAG: glycoside hydrolase family 3 N-terminal domain-containing protein [Bacteroidota bacterium]
MIQALFIFSLLFVWPVFTSHTSHNRDNEQTPIDPPFNNQESRRWADSLFKTLTPDERLGQLFMVAAYSNKDEAEKKRIEYLIKNHHIGGIIFMQGGPVRQASLTNYYQSISKVQLMIAQDAEWGLSMRLDSTPDFHRQLMWGAIQNNQLIYKAGREIARECRRLGVHISFSPVVDINSNPLNPVIGDRSFGENKINVAEKGIAYMRGLQDGKVLASAKHFPGHGDTDKDSHKTLPTATASASRIDSLELYPFIKLVNSGVGSVMVAHLNIPSLDSSGTASTLSSNVVTGLLKNKIRFNGLIFTDALNMKGVADLYPAGEVDVRALIAGNDVLLFSGNVSGAITAIKKAVQDNLIKQDSIDAKVKKILACKHWLELNKKQRVDLKNLHKDINTPEALHIRDELTASALTLVRNKSNLIPFKQRLDTFRFASVSIGSFNETNFQKRLKTYAPVKSFNIDKQASKEDFLKLIDLLKNYTVVFVSLHNMNRKFDNNYGITDNSKLFISELEKKCHVVTTLFGNPYSLKFFEKSNHLLMAYSGENDVQDFAAQLLFGGIPARGILPVSASDEIKAGEGLFTTSCRLRFTDPTDYEFIPNKLNQIDSILEAAIINRAFPGCRMLAIKNNTIFYDKAFGFYTYDRTDSVQLNAVYDVASITKSAATTLAVMNLYE